MNLSPILASILTVISEMSLAEIQVTAVSPQSIATTQEQSVADVAAQWGLDSQDWTAYEQVMRDRRGVWSPGLDPITALGVSADSATDRKRYAELYVRTEFERTRKELAFQLAVVLASSVRCPAAGGMRLGTWISSDAVTSISLRPKMRWRMPA